MWIQEDINDPNKLRKKNVDRDPDSMDPDPDSMNPDPQYCFKGLN
jgi:hypothetical protein